METALTKKKNDYDTVIAYEEARAKEFGDIILKYFSGMTESVEEFKKYDARLVSIQEVQISYIHHLRYEKILTLNTDAHCAGCDR
jgi:hypothetical protein